VRRRGELMQKAGEERPGTMAAVLGLATKEVEAACEKRRNRRAWRSAANINAPDQTGDFGRSDAVTRAGEACKKRGAKRVIPLKVSGAFHSPLMAPAKNHLQLALERAQFLGSGFPRGRQRHRGGRARRRPGAAASWPTKLHGGGPLGRMHAACSALGSEGARFVEIGPGTVLAGLLKRIVPEANVVSLGTCG